MAELIVTTPENTQNIISVVTVKAPLDVVFKAHTEQEQLVKWWAGGEHFDVDYFDARNGGSYRFLAKGEDGRAEDNFRGCFHLVEQNKRVIQTFEWEGMPGHVSVDDSVFEEIEPGMTQVTITSSFASISDRDGMIRSGMESGYRQSVEALGRMLES